MITQILALIFDLVSSNSINEAKNEALRLSIRLDKFKREIKEERMLRWGRIREIRHLKVDNQRLQDDLKVMTEQLHKLSLKLEVSNDN